MNLQKKKEMSPEAQSILFRFVYSIIFVIFISEFIKLSFVEYAVIALVVAIGSLFFVNNEKLNVVIDKSKLIVKNFNTRKFYMCLVFVVGMTELLSLIVVVTVYNNNHNVPVNIISFCSLIVSFILVYIIQRFKVKFFYKFCGFKGADKQRYQTSHGGLFTNFNSFLSFYSLY